MALVLEWGYASLRNLDELTFVLEHFQCAEEVASLWSLIDRTGYYNEQGRLQALPANAKAQYLTFASEPPAAASCLPSFAAPSQNLRRDLAHNLQRLAKLLPDNVRADTIDPSRRRLWELANYLINVVRSYLEEFDKRTCAASIEEQTPPAFYTVVDVRIERDIRKTKRDGVFNLTVDADYIVPDRARRSEKQWAGVGEELHVYCFELPLMLLGNLAVGVPPRDEKHSLFLNGELRIASIDVSNGSGETEAPRRAVHWEPATGAAPLHWINLERLQATG